MDKVKTFIKNEITGWNTFEVSWLAFACAVIIGLSLYWGDNLMGIISATTGVACVVCTAKGKLSAYIFGVINTVLYALIAYNAKYFGDFQLNMFYYLPCQFWGLYVWNKNMNPETQEVNKRRMTNKSRLFLTLGIAIGVLVYGRFLKALGGNLPYVDALSTVASIVAMIVSIKMYMEQWIIWICVDVVTVIMWGYAFANGNDSISTLVMWIVYLLNAVFAYFKWRKEANN